jgi:hypothetical protein
MSLESDILADFRQLLAEHGAAGTRNNLNLTCLANSLKSQSTKRKKVVGLRNGSSTESPFRPHPLVEQARLRPGGRVMRFVFGPSLLELAATPGLCARK